VPCSAFNPGWTIPPLSAVITRLSRDITWFYIITTRKHTGAYCGGFSGTRCPSDWQKTKTAKADIPGIIAVAVLGADLSVLILDDVLHLVGLGQRPDLQLLPHPDAVVSTESTASARIV
jgi:hypothetical protein